MAYRKFRREVAYYMQRLCKEGLTTSSGGNISTRNGEVVLITPSSTDKTVMEEDDVIAVDLEGRILESPKGLKPSIECAFHLMVYKTRKDVSAIVHAHPVYATSIAASTAEIENTLVAESYAILGKIAYVPFSIMGSNELADNIGHAVTGSDCIVMRNHGILALGKNLFQAFDRMEVAENAAKITIICKEFLKGKSVHLPEKELKAIDHLMGR